MFCVILARVNHVLQISDSFFEGSEGVGNIFHMGVTQFSVRIKMSHVTFVPFRTHHRQKLFFVDTKLKTSPGRDEVREGFIVIAPVKAMMLNNISNLAGSISTEFDRF